VKRLARESRNSTFMSVLVSNGHCENSINVRYSPKADIGGFIEQPR
jgi:hypothetical protein